ncbi:MAG TPA: DNA polymerase III subunit gamma/tau, partial [bacterium]
MDFVVLARKLRPARFEHLIGQDTVVRALRNAILTDRVAHAFLFAGSRGVGKTSTARILTKALNCEQPADGEPCNACDNCREITLNTSPDVYEIDAASNRGIDNIRELRENTKYTPVKCRFKTYIIDEVHMLTMESFNALLKTLEEPPPHVKFILATTNPHRIPDTILSRCQRYDFARIPLAALTDYLVEVTGREGIRLSRGALQTIARNAAGGVRDALTAVDQVVSFAGQEASDAQVLSILGLTDNREVFTLLGAVLDKELPAALEALAAVREHGHDLGVLLEAMIREIKD